MPPTLFRRTPAPSPGERVDLALAEGSPVVAVPVGTAATSEGAVRELDPAAAVAFGIPADGNATATRRQAMQVPGIKRGRNLVCSTLGTLPLVARTTEGRPLPVEVSTTVLLRELDPRTTPAWQLAYTADRLMFHGVAWWRVLRRDVDGWPINVELLAHERVQVHPPTQTRMGYVSVDGQEVDDRDLIRFDALDDALLVDGAAIVHLALALIRAGRRVADDDWSGLILRLAEGADELTRAQVIALLTDWEASRRARTTAYLNRAVEPEKVSVSAQDRQLTELSGWVDTQLARLMNLPASRISAPQGSGMTYTNTESDRRDLVDTTLAPYLVAIAQRLSMPDVTPAGVEVRFDLTRYLRGTTSELVASGAAAIAAGLTDAPEVRTEWLQLPPRTDLPAPTPAREDTPA